MSADARGDQQSESDQLTLVDGTQLENNLSAIDSNGAVTLVGQDASIRLNDIWRVSRPSIRQKADPKATVEVTLIDDSRFLTSELTGNDESFQLSSMLEHPVELPVEVVRSVRIVRRVTDQRLQQAVDSASDSDTLFVVMNDKPMQLQGYFERLEADVIRFQWQDKPHTLPRNQWNGLVLASLEEAPDETSRGRMQLSNGSAFWATIKSLQDDVVDVVLTGGSEARLPWTSVSQITFRSPRMEFVSDLKPIDVIEETVVTLPQPWQRDVSVEGRPLTLGSRAFEKGLGVHARSLLTFDTVGGYDLFVATIGIDAETQGRGDCIFIVRGDGRELHRQRVRGRDEPREIRVPITKVRQLALLVEPGAELDMADHADWCDARLVRNRETATGD
ncbi:MAG TPA: NPCBM/NEW2 domain-containing protein [Pirellulales bacterium]|nr:NPCBM/NEW2 domain-containing protein [Pirellulales bacterium]